jgi:competence protein ComEA
MEPDLPSVDIKKPQKNSNFDFEEFIFNFRKPLVSILGGLILIGLGLIAFKSSSFLDSTKVEVLNVSPSQGPTLRSTKEIEIVVDISGSIEKPGVYRLKEGARIDDLLVQSGGISANADREWVNKNLNRAAKLNDGQKIYIPNEVENKISIKNITSSTSGVAENVAGVMTSGLININTASQKELDSLPGIGPVYAQSIIEKRIYSDVSELLSKGALKKSVYEKVKDKVTVN